MCGCTLSNALDHSYKIWNLITSSSPLEHLFTIWILITNRYMVQNLEELRKLAARAQQLNSKAVVDYEKRQKPQLSYKRRQEYEEFMEQENAGSGDETETQEERDLRRNMEYTLEENENWASVQHKKRQNVADSQSLDYGEAAARDYNKRVRSMQAVQNSEDPVQALIDDLTNTVEARQQRRVVGSNSGYINDANRQFNVRLDRLTKPSKQPWSHFEF